VLTSGYRQPKSSTRCDNMNLYQIGVWYLRLNAV